MKMKLRSQCLFALFVSVSAAAPVHVYEKVEITLTATGKYANPYTGVDVWVDLKGPHFNKRCNGFWDGGQTYRVRITSLEPGTWTWVSGSNPPDPGLAGKRGSFVSIPWTEAEKRQNPNRRGFPRATPNGHALQYADGTPYFIVGDFFYPASTWRYRWRDSDEAYAVDTPEAGFKDMLKLRKSQDFNMIYIISSFPSWAYDEYSYALQDKAGVALRNAWPSGDENKAENMPNEDGERPFFFPGKAVGYPNTCPDYMRLNPSYFRFLDKKIDYANALGFRVFLETLRRDIAPYLKAYYGATNPDLSKNAVFHYIRYIFARYQADPVFFGIIHQDVGENTYGLPARDWLPSIEGYYKKYGPPPFGQIVTTNINASTYRVWGHTDKAPWLTMHQAGNSPRDHTSSDAILEMYNLPNPIPAYNQEPWYIANDTPEERRRNRSTMYSCLLNGGLAGVAHQAMGLTRGNRENSSTYVNMWVSIAWQSANEARLAPAFLMADGVNYQNLAPHRELLSVFKGDAPAWVGTGPARVAPQEGWAYCMRTDDKRHFKLYFERNVTRPDLSGAIPSTVYKAQWFDPRTGAWNKAGAGTLTSDAQGRIALPACPTSADDWGLSLSPN
jgi:hypothetical protein